MQNSQAELDRFVNAVRTWKKRAWNEAMGIPEGSSIPPPSLRP
jgi:hypothetical protein